jgi:hypothetical protein
MATAQTKKSDGYWSTVATYHTDLNKFIANWWLFFKFLGWVIGNLIGISLITICFMFWWFLATLERFRAGVSAIVIWHLVKFLVGGYFTYDISTELPMLFRPDPLTSLEIWNIKDYAEDPNHESSIEKFLEGMGDIETADDAQKYIDKYSYRSKKSPVTGDMVFKSATEYELSPRLLLALMRKDSQFGTNGKAERTHNPGNVFTFWKHETDMITWQYGVDAIAWWLDNHRFDKTPQSTSIPPPVAKFYKDNGMTLPS